MVQVSLASNSTISPSDPTAMVPLWGKSPNSLAGLVAVSATKRCSDRPRCRPRLAGGHGLLDEDLDHLAIFRMHADHGTMSASETHGFEQGAVVKHEDARVRHEQFEAGDAFTGNEGLHISQ